jgi:NADP-dependent 3-hydroxy acid dehydrogenase YdfG
MLPLLKRSTGQVVFVNSTAGLVARARVGQYAATKHALKALADALREEVNADGVRVLSVFLGRTASSMQQYVHEAEGRRYAPDRLVQPDDVAAMIVHALCLPRTAEVTEMRIRPLASPGG